MTATEPRTCRHLSINVSRNDEYDITIWACAECRRRFYPACEECVTVGHRSGHGEHVEAEAAASRPAALLREVIEEVESEERRWLEWWARGGKGVFVWKRAAVQRAKEAIGDDQQA